MSDSINWPYGIQKVRDYGVFDDPSEFDGVPMRLPDPPSARPPTYIPPVTGRTACEIAAEDEPPMIGLIIFCLLIFLPLLVLPFWIG